MKTRIICFGKLDKKFFIEAANDYSKRISKFSNIEVIELKEEFNGEDVKNKEVNSNTLMAKLDTMKDYQIVVLDVASKNVSSEDLATLIENNKNFKGGKIAFIIGPSDGYSDTFKNRYSNKISFGNITLPHQLFRVILLEQVYRAFKIMNNEKYHK
ncbi:23S rRNA (pseudouridine(1915)-N(3))-methyltransferase RlmH [[Acholeplasma] multilocale]|uniref:23S rRNA (pseudouridine(1915)-N(3))-methyltransferase RlmH n=1 Tax=[Acholeplasma] multilocale TaxID=264638 RepID=UPI000426A145|nr:23S rRNA (pseudouridine(1915)-N(3))-methyltransferase RlmH [[Acholeplasma] multilocale]